MRVKVVRDTEGKVLATIDVTPNPLVTIEPVEDEKQKIRLEEMDAPKNYEYRLTDFYKEIQRKRPQ